jgi:hypothetical protein
MRAREGHIMRLRATEGWGGWQLSDCLFSWTLFPWTPPEEGEPGVRHPGFSEERRKYAKYWNFFFQLLFYSRLINENGLKQVKCTFVSKFSDSPRKTGYSILEKVLWMRKYVPWSLLYRNLCCTEVSKTGFTVYAQLHLHGYKRCT